MRFSFHLILTISIISLISCNKQSKNDTAGNVSTDTVTVNTYKATINLPPPNEKESAVKYSKVIGWPEGKTPTVPEGLSITKFASGLKSPRNIYVAPNGDIFVALANTESKGIKKKITDEISGRNESQHTQSSLNQVYLFRDNNGDGKPEVQTPYITGLNQPFGMLILNNYFYVANTDGILRYPYKDGDTRIDAKGEKILDLPAGGYNNHWTRNLISNNDGSKIFVSVGSASNVAEHGIQEEQFRANILEINPDGTGKRIFASGLRNPVGMDILPGTSELWTVVNERDELGDNLVPDYLTQAKEGGFYGWPYSYFGQHIDPRIKQEDQKPELVQQAIVPDLPLDSHSSSMGIVFYEQKQLPEKYQGGAFIAQHGSWNRSAFTGYRVAFVPFKNGKLAGPAEDFVTGFIADAEKGEVYGRPVATAVTKEGNLLITDDASDTIWLVRESK
ncbi:PQQ-dependent sugar dehydrogenase [Chryseosolibacter indicus]|uniref:Sorbosone dehydrogenase family protein n=1 Tax=Chryseosolibacter indicus TaxID=2782351 RepID=A0ABS5VX41_9BACT|nr:sorbosone dehydrogenase family protein [Chryseosolibacter indicus]MBT1705977.1 sorbosone dehydrogenase family protein [Chryseosolibacter indicus]